jgi:hypothetical protein
MRKVFQKKFFVIVKNIILYVFNLFLFFQTLFSNPNAVTNLVAISGLPGFPEGSIKLVWTYPGPESLPENSNYYIQYSTFSEISWSTAAAQVIISTGPVIPNDVGEYLVTYLTGFVKETTYYFKLWISSGTDILSDISNTATGWITLIPPGKASFVDIVYGENEGEIKLSWSGVGDDGNLNTLDNGSKWLIDYSTDSQHSWNYDFVKITISTSGITSSTTVSYTVTGLISGATYFFRIWTKDDLSNISEISDGATMWAQVDVSPPKVVTSIFVEGGFKHAKLTWVVPQEDSNLTPYNTDYYQGSFEIRYSSCQITDENLWSTATSAVLITDVILTPNISTITVITNLTNQTSYYFAIKVADEKYNWSTITGSSSPLVFVKNSIPNYYPPGNISKHYAKDPKKDFVISTIISTTSVVLDWTDVGWTAGWNIIGSSDSFYGDFISSFTIRISTFVVGTNIGFATKTVFGITETSCTITDLLEDTTYWWDITVFDSESLSKTVFSSTTFKFMINYSNTYSPTFPPNPLLKPTTVWHTKDFSIEFDWKDAFDRDAGDFVSEYKLFISTDSNFNFIVATISVTGSPATSYFLLNTVSTPSSTILLPYDNQKIYWYVIAYDSGAPFGYPSLESLPTQTTFFYINQLDEPPRPFEVYPVSGPYVVTYYDLPSETTFYIVKSTPIYLYWDLTTDPDPEDAVIEYAIFIGTSLAKDPELGTFDGSWRYDVNFSSTVIDSNPASGSVPGADLYLVENATYYWRVRARDREGSLHWIWQSTPNYAPPADKSPMMFIIDFTSDAPKNYDAISPTNVYNPTNLSGEINFSWQPVIDPDPFDKTKYLYLFVSTYVPQSAESWVNATITTITPLVGYTTFYTTTLFYDLIPGDTYFWQVLSWGEREWGTTTSTSNPFTATPYGLFNSTASFVVSNNPPNKFNLIFPGTATSSGLYSGIKIFNPTFYWEVVTDDDNYEPIISSFTILISSYPDFSYKTEIWVSTNNYYFSLGLQPKTTYWWTVVAYDKFNNYQTPYSTFVFKVENLPPNMFLLVSPIDEEIVSTSTPVFEWQNNGDPDGDDIYYTIQYSSYSDFRVYTSSGYFMIPSQTGTTVQINSPWELEDNGQFYWRVVAKDTSTYTQEVTTSNISTFWVNYIEESPNNFDLHITSGFVNTLTPSFSWNSTTDPDPKDYVVYYKLCISTVSSYVVGTSTYIIIFGSNTTNYTLPTPLVENGIYRWWVEAYDTTGRFTKSSSSYVFTCNTQFDGLDNFNLISPGSEYGYFESPQPVTFKWELANRSEWWNTNVEYVVYYGSISVNISTITVFSSVYRESMESELITLTTSVTLSGLQENTTYFWWVKADYKTQTETSTKYSTTFYFFVNSVNDPPSQFSLISPTGTVTSRTPQFLWQESVDVDDGISKYVLKYSSDINFSVTITTSITISNPVLTTYKLPSEYILSMNTTYYWKVVAYDKSNSSATSISNATFFVPIFYPSTFTILSPSKNVFTKKPQILWNNSVPGEENSFISFYELNLYTSIDFSSKITTYVTTTQYVPETNLLQNATYYLQMFAYDNFGTKSDVVIYSFYIHRINIPKKIEKLNYNLSVNGFIISWQKINEYEDGSKADDIIGYNIYRSSNISDLAEPITISKYMFLSSTMTPLFVELVSETTFYYLVKVVTLTGIESAPSEIVTNYNQGSKVLYMPEMNVKIVLPLKVRDQLVTNGCDIYVGTKTISSAEETQLNMLNKYDIFVTKDGQPINLQLDSPIELEFAIPPTFSTISKTQNLNSNLTPKLFWHNGIEYIYLNSGYTNGKLTAITKNLGNFVIRAVSFSDKNAIVNIYPKKIFTPTVPVDNKIHFVVNNITASQPEGEIYDLDLRYVAKMKYENYELVWDGRYETGEFVPKGIYLYKIKIGEDIFTGTIIVAK